MKLHTIILFSFLMLLACKKEPKPNDTTAPVVDSTDSTSKPVNPIDTTDSTKVVVVDTSIKAKGLPDTIFLKHIDSVIIPIVIMRDSGTVQNITLSTPTSISERMKASLSVTTGTTPLNTTLKITNYLGAYNVDNGHLLILTINTSTGKQYYDTTKIFFRDEKNFLQRFYETYLNDTLLITTDENGAHQNWRPRIGYNSTDGLNFSNLLLFADASDTVYSIDNGSARNGLKFSSIFWGPSGPNMDFFGSNRGRTNTGLHPTFNFYVENIVTDYAKLHFVANSPEYYKLTYTIAVRFTPMGPTQKMNYTIWGRYVFK